MRIQTLLLVVVALLFAVPDGSQAQSFGGAVAVGENEMFVGYTSNTSRSGTVYVYRKDGDEGRWLEVAQLGASDATGQDDRFGRALHVNGGQLFVGATTRDSTRGAVYVFERSDDGRWEEKQILAASDSEPGDAFGRSLAFGNNVLLVGAAGADNLTGSVYAYRYDALSSSWSEIAVLRGSAVEEGDLFGLVVSFNGEWALISAPKQGGDSVSDVYVYHYDVENSSWTDAGRLKAEAHVSGDGFGTALAQHGSKALVGAPGSSEGVGAVYSFEYEPSRDSWMLTSTLVPTNGESGIGFGVSVASHGRYVSVGAPGAAGGTGTVFTYEPDAQSKWTEVGIIEAPASASGFGGSLALANDRALVGLPSSDFGLGRAIAFESSNESNAWTAVAEFYDEIKSMASVTGGRVPCEEGEASSFDCQKVDLLSFLSVGDIGGNRGVRVNDLWGWTDAQTEEEYAIVGRVDGTSFVDISDPQMPRYLGNLSRTEGARPSSWRDIKVYADHAFIVSDGAGNHGVQIFDLTQLRDVEEPVDFTETAHYDGIHSAHNIVINEDTGFAYTVGNSSGGETCGGGSHMIDIRDPKNPTFAGCFAHESTGRSGTGYTHDAQCVTYHGPDETYTGREVCFGANETALSVADVTDKENPTAISSTSYPNVGYAHQGWLTEDHRYFLLDDELDELNGSADGTRTLIWDVSELEDPQLIKEYVSDDTASDHNLYIKGNLVYQSNYVSGLRILDISDITNPVPVAFFDTVPGPGAPGFDGSWSNYPFFKSGVIAVTSGEQGLFLLKKPDIGL